LRQVRGSMQAQGYKGCVNNIAQIISGHIENYFCRLIRINCLSNAFIA